MNNPTPLLRVNFDNACRSVPFTGGCKPVTLASSGAEPQRYFTTQRDTSGIANQGSVMRTLRSGGGSAELVWKDSGLYPNPSGIAVDSQAIYWVEYDNSLVYRLAK